MKMINANRRTAKKAKSIKTQRIKVVYISNPMKVVANPANFRAVVQELTGQHSDSTYMFDSPSTSSTVGSSGCHVTGGASVDLAVANNDSIADFRFDMFDDSFTSQILEDFWRIHQ